MTSSFVKRFSLDDQYREYLRRLDARAVLDHYGIDNSHDEINRSGETEVVHSCILDRVDTHHNNGDRKPSASANLDRKLYICHAYWGGDFFHLIQRMEGKDSFSEIIPVLSPFLTGALLSADELRQEMESLLSVLQDPRSVPELPSYSPRVLAPWAFIHPYLHERGIDSGTASRLQIGWRSDDNRITIPHFWGGKLVGWQSRAVPDRPGLWPGTASPDPKYKSTNGFPKSTTFYYDHSRPFPQRGTVIVVESPLSVIKSVALGSVVPVLATFGAKVSDQQTAMLFDYDQVLLWPDPDPAGQLMERTLCRRLRDHPGLSIIDSDPGKDLADCQSLAELESKIESATPAVLR